MPVDFTMLDCMSSIIHPTNLSLLMLRTASTSFGLFGLLTYFRALLCAPPGSPPVLDVTATLMGWGRLETFGVRLRLFVHQPTRNPVAGLLGQCQLLA